MIEQDLLSASFKSLASILRALKGVEVCQEAFVLGLQKADEPLAKKPKAAFHLEPPPGAAL